MPYLNTLEREISLNNNNNNNKIFHYRDLAVGAEIFAVRKTVRVNREVDKAI
jgi:hypothetical protein